MDLHRKNRREQLKSIIDFAESLHVETIESNNCGDTAQSKPDALRHYINTALQITQVPDPAVRAELDAVGTRLWNSCTRSMRKEGLNEGIIKWLSRGS
ncbi:predicted protein [Uncinocarpus reesii 1704]|uniref:Uncharacterized protein n=1 Tax=Uncinocarpus reesii (strain UAMH 1704) TaxID=336963 RepID=C4JXM9_UNCRE|nr:uncharacterized protein UREG_06402 [Uncinocarpus reesii 1704]EEP81537.1 predicted protein [Uncinocarpus reesii 1704]